nr:IDEAL domain-containing protein [uncultured Bacillus sp.]
MDFIVAAKNGIDVECLYYGYKKDDMISKPLTLQFGDTLQIENQGKYIVGVGWFVLITINNKVKQYVCAEDLEEYIRTNDTVSPVDCMLDYFNLSYQLDKALENRDKAAFLSLTGKKSELSALYDIISGKIPV